MKSYLAAVIERRETKKHTRSAPSKPTEPGFAGFDGCIAKRLTVWKDGKTFAEAKQKIAAALDAMTNDERQAVADALDERTAVVILENDCDYETAMRAAEKDVLSALIH